MASQSYELSFGLSIVLIFVFIVFSVLALNLLFSLLRIIFNRILVLFKSTEQKKDISKSSQDLEKHSLKQE